MYEYSCVGVRVYVYVGVYLKEGYTCGCVGGGGGKQKYTIVRKGRWCWFTETCTFAFWLALGVPARPESPHRRRS